MSSPSSSTATSAGDPIADGLQQVLAAEHACVYGYPALGTHLTDDGQVGQARSQEEAHRLLRDAVAEQLVTLGQTPVAASVGYAPPSALTSDQAAQQWALQLEEQVAAAYRYLLLCAIRAGGAQPGIRNQAVTGLTTAASSGLYWRRLTTPGAPTAAFPGSS